MKNTIAVEGIKLYAYHGCLDEEGLIGGHYIVDVYMEIDFAEAAKKDDLTKTVDYCAVYEIAKEQLAIRSKLIEQAAMRIHTAILKDFKTITKAKVRVSKLNPPMHGHVEKVYVEIE